MKGIESIILNNFFIPQFLFLVAVVATVAARPQHGHQQKHNHGHVFLPQHILLHQTTNVKLSTAPIEKHKNNRQDVLFRHGEHNVHRGGKVGPHHKEKETLDPTSSSKSIQQPIEKETEKETEKYVRMLQFNQIIKQRTFPFNLLICNCKFCRRMFPLLSNQIFIYPLELQ